MVIRNPLRHNTEKAIPHITLATNKTANPCAKPYVADVPMAIKMLIDSGTMMPNHSNTHAANVLETNHTIRLALKSTPTNATDTPEKSTPVGRTL